MSKEEQMGILIKYCESTYREKLKTAKILFNQKRYADCLFFCHLTLEMVLKGMYVKKHKKSFPVSHHLPTLIELCEVKLSEEMLNDIKEINGFNIRARYDDYKRSFYEKANLAYTKNFLNKTLKYIKWFKKF